MTSYFLRVFGAMVLALLVSAALYSFAQAAPYSWTSPPSSVEMHGYAWSDNIGWISFNCDNHAISSCTDYKVEINDDGTLSGHAWSDNIGWIQLGGLGTPPGSNGGAHLEEIGSDLFIYGWARACSVFVSGCSGALRPSLELGGWDGWISLHCEDDGSCGTTDYGTDVGNSTLSGFAWGGDVIGWLDMSMVTFDPFDTSLPVVTFEAGDPVANDWTEGLYPMPADTTDVVLRWSATNADWCEEVSGISFDTGSTRPTGGPTAIDDIDEPADGDSYNYVIRCYNSSGGEATETVTVHNPLDPTLPSVKIWARPVGSSALNNPYPYISDGTDVEVRWESANATLGCVAVAGTDFDTNGDEDGTDDVFNPADGDTMTFTVRCENSAGFSPDASVTVANQTVSLVPTGVFGAEPRIVRSGESAVFSWTVANTNDICRLYGPGGFITAGRANENNVAYGPIYGRTEFSLKCEDVLGTSFDIATPITIQVVAAYEEN